MKKFALSVLALALSSATFASYPQKITLCLDVKGNTSDAVFNASFVSSDFFEVFRHWVWGVNNGMSCATHTYSYGPKNIKFSTSVVGFENKKEDILILQDGSCAFMHRSAYGALNSQYIRTAAPAEKFIFTLSQTPPMNGFKYSYTLHCERAS